MRVNDVDTIRYSTVYDENANIGHMKAGIGSKFCVITGRQPKYEYSKLRYIWFDRS